ncbi:hypothetical protein L6452_08573 [Arctium lappa]|uniref:Uncharacterized protein n=1 Tax=Arctium lappa TaxID=4217 RepID=A0ACB9DI36_ARCLA|nr:hypothetical protein L6452_08573 [Arctium lappa]
MEMEKLLSNIWIGSYRLRAFLALQNHTKDAHKSDALRPGREDYRKVAWERQDAVLEKEVAEEIHRNQTKMGPHFPLYGQRKGLKTTMTMKRGWKKVGSVTRVEFRNSNDEGENSNLVGREAKFNAQVGRSNLAEKLGGEVHKRGYVGLINQIDASGPTFENRVPGPSKECEAFGLKNLSPDNGE